MSGNSADCPGRSGGSGQMERLVAWSQLPVDKQERAQSRGVFFATDHLRSVAFEDPGTASVCQATAYPGCAPLLQVSFLLRLCCTCWFPLQYCSP
jgi:hypothetical protein